MIFINGVPYDLPSTAYLESSLYIIHYIPDPDYKFSHWQLSGIEFTSKSDYENPNLVSVTSSGELRALYVRRPYLRIERNSSLCDAFFSESPIRLEVEVKYSGEPICEAQVIFYVDDEWKGARSTDTSGQAYIDFEPPEDGVYTWYVIAEKSGYSTTTCEEWEFAFGQIELRPPDNDTISDLPIGLSALMELNEIPIKDVSVYFYVDDEYHLEAFTQTHGFASVLIDDLSPGFHTWYVTAWIPGFINRFSSEMRSFTYRPELSVFLLEPTDGENIGEVTSDLELRATACSASKVVQGVNCSFYVEGSYLGSVPSDERGDASLEFSPPKENETYSWYVTVTKPGYNNYTSQIGSFYYPVQPPYIEVDRVYSSKERADVGSVQEIGFHLRWKNGTDVEGADIRIKDDHTGETDERGWVYFKVKSDDVCERHWEILEVTCDEAGLFKHNNNYPKIIWDSVFIELSTKKGRVDLGSNATIIKKAYYEYDETPFYGSIIYNEEPYSDEVDEKIIGVKEIHDEKHNLTAFSSNEIVLIWDRANLHLDVSSSRVQVGLEADITYTGTYEYDNRRFEGTIILDRSLEMDRIGEVTYTVIGIEDDLYDLSSFKANQVSCVFDKIEYIQDISTTTPTKVSVETRVYYKYDGKPVVNADVKVNGVGVHTGSGVYESVLFSFFPLMKISTEIKLGGFDTRTFETVTVVLGNASMWSGVVLITLLLLWRKLL